MVRSAAMPESKRRPKEIEVRATVNLAGLRAGELALVDPRSPYIASLIERRYLVPEGER